MSRTWLWLEDQSSTVRDIANAIDGTGVSVLSFRTPGELINQLVDWRQKEDSRLDRIGFLLDILLVGQQFITCPKEWYGGKEPTYHKTQNGYDAGLVFYESCVLGGENQKEKKRMWAKPPPVLFLTVLHPDAEVSGARLEKIKQRWGEAHSVPEKDAQVDWIHKWDSEIYDKLVQRLNDWGEIPE